MGVSLTLFKAFGHAVGAGALWFSPGSGVTERIGIIGGSGLGEELLSSGQGQAVEIQTPFGPPSAPPILAEWQGIPVAILARHGPGHCFNPTQVPYRANIFAMKVLGCRWILASGAVGSLDDAVEPRALVLVDQAIDRTVHRPRTFFEEAAVHVDFADPICPELREIVVQASDELENDIKIHRQGTYVCMEGPAFSTRAESLLHKSWGGDVIGMTLMPEAKLAREAEIAYASIALVTDFDCWRPHPPGKPLGELLKEIISHLHSASDSAQELIRAAIPRIWAARDREFASQRSLALGIWSDKSRITPEVKLKLAPLWGRYF